ncbi:Undecaprenol kinase [Planctomycetes bacterium MalM25]|nr:Undecaprenol kinase [Planctomycetes bacterium MalM25]
MADRPDFKPSTWLGKFACAFRGLWVGVRGQSSFAIHIPVMIGVLVMGCVVSVPWVEWCLLLLAISLVLAAELVNSALEVLAKAVTDEYSEPVRDALDIASAVVFVASFGAACVGLIILFG